MTDTSDGTDISTRLERVRTRLEFASELTMLRERAGLTVRDVAKAVRVPVSTIGGYFAGTHLPSARPPDLVRRILSACGVSEADELNEWMRALARVRHTPGPRPANAPPPYRGLASFQPEHADWFFGREDLTEQLVDDATRLGTTGGLLAVVGPSGSGKSSLLRAGLIPAVRAGRLAIPGSADWPVVLITPGAHPVSTLAQELAALTGDPTPAVSASLLADPTTARGMAWKALRTRAADAGEPAFDDRDRLVIVVDQFEEVFTACSDEGERRDFISALTALGHPSSGHAADERPRDDGPAALVVIGLRADFYASALRYPELAAALQHAQVVVGPMTETGLRRAIVEPARRAKVDIDDSLVELLLSELAPTSDDPSGAHSAGALPLLSHALLATWERGHRARLTVADYRDSGGIRGAVARTAEEAYGQLSKQQRELARRVFLRLVHVADDAADTRRYVAHDELALLDGNVQVVLDTFIDHRLVTAELDRVAITHEAVLLAWPRLRRWIDSDRVGLRTHRHLTTDAETWRDLRRDPHALYRGGRLAIAMEWAADPAHQTDLNPLEQEFLDASIAHDLAEQRSARTRTRRLQQLLAALTALLLASGISAAYAFQQRAVADEQRNLAIARQVATTANQVRGKDIGLAMQLSLVAYRVAAIPESRSSLLDSYGTPTVTRMLGPSGVMQSISFTRDGRLMAAAGTDKMVRLWHVPQQGVPTRAGAPLTGHTDTIYSVAFSPDRHTLASAGGDRTVRLWNVSDPDHPSSLGTPLTGPTNTVYTLAFSPDGHLLAAGSADQTIRLWNVSDPSRPVQLGSPLTGPTGYVQSVAFSPDGKLLAAGSADQTIRLYDITDPSRPLPLGPPLTGPTKTVYSVTFSPDGHTLAAGSGDGTVTLWNTTHPSTPTRTAALTGPTSWVNSVAFSPDGHRIAAASSDSNLWIWDTSTRSTVAVLPHPAPLTTVVYPDDTSDTIATSAADGAARLWHIPGPVISRPTGTVFTTSFAANGRLAVTDAGNAGGLWDISEPRRPQTLSPTLSQLSTPGPASGTAALSPDGHTLAAGDRDGGVQLWDVTNPDTPALLPTRLPAHTATIQTMAFTPDSRLLAVGSNDKTVTLWDVSDPRQPTLLHRLSGPTNYVLCVAFSPDGHTLAISSADNSVRLWNVRDPTAPTPLATPLTGPTNYVYSVAFSPDGHTLAAGSADNTVRLWDVRNPTAPTPLGRPLTGPDNYVYSVAFSHDSRTLAAAAGDGTVWLWNTTDIHHPSPYATITAHNKPVYTVAFEPGRDILATGSADRTARLWNTDPDQVANYVCATAGDPITRSEWNKYLPNLPYRPPCEA